MVSRLIKYVATRILLSIPILFILLTFFFALTHILPGDPAVWLAGEKADPAAIEEIRHKMGLDKPMHIQLFDYFSAMLRGDFGVSYASHRSVMTEIFEAFPVTLELSIGAMIVALLLGVPFGVIAALKQNGIADHIVRILCVSSVSIPVFWLGIILQIVFGITLGILPTGSRIDPAISIQRITGLLVLDSILTFNLRGLASALSHLFLPTVSLGLVLFPSIARIARSSLITELSEDYITTAKAKGVPRSRIVYKYALRNALVPVVSTLGLSIVGLMGGAVLEETVFSLPGVGRLLVRAAYGRDYLLLQACVLVIALFILIGNTAMDVVYAKLDPRITL